MLPRQFLDFREKSIGDSSAPSDRGSVHNLHDKHRSPGGECPGDSSKDSDQNESRQNF